MNAGMTGSKYMKPWTDAKLTSEEQSLFEASQHQQQHYMKAMMLGEGLGVGASAAVASSRTSHEDQVTGKLMKELYVKMQWNQKQINSDLFGAEGHSSARDNKTAKFINVATK